MVREDLMLKGHASTDFTKIIPTIAGLGAINAADVLFTIKGAVS